MAKELDSIKMWESILIQIDKSPYDTVHAYQIHIALKDQGFKFDGEHIVPIEENKGNNGGISPKFKVGDWITRGEHYTYKIVGVGHGLYVVNKNNEEEVSLTFEYVEKHFHTWAITDAKDGDVLVCEDFGYTSLILFKSFSNGRISLHYWYNSQTNNFNLNTDVALRKDANIHPATKEQRNLLFQKIHEGDYEWDAKNKQLLILSNVERTGKNCKELTEFEKELAKIIGFGVSTAVVNPKEGVDEFAKKYAPKLIDFARKQIADDIVKQYADKGEKNYQDDINDVYEDEMASSYWDGFRDCANGILRELKDE